MAGTLRVLIDARMLMGRFSGVARMVTSLIENLVTMPHVRVLAICGNEPYEPWKHRTDLEMIISDFSREHRSPARRLLWEATKLQHWIEQSGADVFHATWNSGVPIRCPVPSVLTVHDIIPWDEPARRLSTWFSRRCYRHGLRASVRHAQCVTTVSGFTADQIVRKTGIDPSWVRVIYNGVEEAKPVVMGERYAERPYVLYVGGHELRKNLRGALRAIHQYWLQYDPAMELRLTGSPNQLSDDAKAIYEELNHESRIRFIGSPSDEALSREYAGATALLMLSRAEGFGLPVIEAMANGCPVIAARCGALPEIVGEAGILVDPDDSESIANAIHQLTTSATLVGELVAKGRQRAVSFTWKRAAEAYLREYQFAASSAVAHVEPLRAPPQRVWQALH